MVRDPSAPPAEFVSYVETRLPSLVHAARRYVADERFADQVARDLLASVALRWPWYARSFAGSRRDPARAADRFLHRAFRDTVKDYADPQQEIALTLDLDAQYPAVPLQRSRPAGRLGAAEEAEFLWERSAQTVRRRSLIAGGLGLIGLVMLVSRRKAPPQTAPVEPPPSPTPQVTAIPRGIDLLPTLAEQGRLRVRTTRLPPELNLRQAAVTLPRGHRALGVFSAADESSVLLLDDGKLYAVPDIRVRPDNPGAMSPDGRYIAYRDTQQQIFDITTGRSHPLTEVTTVSPPIWLDPTRMLFSVVGGGQVVGVDGRLFEKLPVDLSDVVVPQGNPSPIAGDPVLRATELLSVGRPLTAPARIRRYADSDGGPVDVILNGDLTSWIGLWRGVGFGMATAADPADRGLLVRRCQTSGHLPLQSGEPESAIAVVRAATGGVLRVLVDTTLTGADRVEPLGWLDASTVLVSTTSEDVSLILAWGVEKGSLELVTVVSRAVRMALADLSLIGPR